MAVRAHHSQRPPRADPEVRLPSCGSGNFLYLSLLGLKDLENRVILDAEALGLPRAFPMVGPQCVLGIELNPYAAELARVTIWIGQIQWMLRHGWGLDRNPILQKLDQIANRDALLNDDATEAEWPPADAIVGNPPFLGDKKMLAELGDEYVAALRKRFLGRVPGGADLVTYWFEKARACIEGGTTARAGLVSTNSIRTGKNRNVLDRICQTARIFDAWADEPWVVEGASVRVSLICFGQPPVAGPKLNGTPMGEILANLTGRDSSVPDGMPDFTSVATLSENSGVAFSGISKKGAFDLSGSEARSMLLRPLNPNGAPNSEVLFPWKNGDAVTGRDSDKWLIHFGERTEDEASLFETPFERVKELVKSQRLATGSPAEKRNWWLLARRAPDMFAAIRGLSRFMATPEVSKHRIFVWLRPPVVPDLKLVVIAREDDTSFGVLTSRFHRLWSLATCSWHGAGNDPRYTSSTTFRTFPFPAGLTPDITAAEYAGDLRAVTIAEAARRLNELRENWLDPPDLVKRIPEVVAGYPDRIVPVDAAAAQELKKRTLTNIYNQRPQWLVKAHEALDTAVAAAYGWDADISDEEALRRLLALNLERANRTAAKVIEAAPAAAAVEGR